MPHFELHDCAARRRALHRQRVVWWHQELSEAERCFLEQFFARAEEHFFFLSKFQIRETCLLPDHHRGFADLWNEDFVATALALRNLGRGRMNLWW